KNFRDVQYSMLAVIIRNRKATDVDRMARIVGARDRRGSVVERHCDGKNLEDRAKFINAERVPIEHPIRQGKGGMFGVRNTRMVRIEIRQRHHRQDFAGVDVHDQSGSALRGEIIDDPLQLLTKDVLDAEVERQLERFPTVPKRVVQTTFDSGKARVVDAGVADDMRRQRPVWIDAALFVLELQGRKPELVYLVLFARRQMALYIDEALSRGQLGVDLRALEAGKGLHQFPRGISGVVDLFRVGIDGRAVERGGQQLAIAIDNVGA